MNFDDVEKILSENLGMPICPVCGLPYKPYRAKTQKTCGDTECKAEYHRRRVRERAEEARAADEEGFKKRHRDSMRKYRGKQRKLERRVEQLQDISERWERQAEFDKYVSEHGHEYGKRQAEKTLSQVPKIDVNIGKERKR